MSLQTAGRLRRDKFLIAECRFQTRGYPWERFECSPQMGIAKCRHRENFRGRTCRKVGTCDARTGWCDRVESASWEVVASEQRMCISSKFVTPLAEIQVTAPYQFRPSCCLAAARQHGATVQIRAVVEVRVPEPALSSASVWVQSRTDHRHRRPPGSTSPSPAARSRHGPTMPVPDQDAGRRKAATRRRAAAFKVVTSCVSSPSTRRCRSASRGSPGR